MLEIISYIASGLLTILTPILFVKIVLKRNIKVTKIKAIFLISIFCIIVFTIQHYIEGTAKTIAYFISYILCINAIYKLDYLKTAILVSIYLLELMLVDGVTLLFSIYILNISKEIFYEKFVDSFALNCIIYLTVIIVTYYIRRMLINILNYKLDTNKKIIIMLVVTSICMFYFFYKAFADININQSFYVSIGIIIVFLAILYMLIKQFIINNQISLEYDKLLEFMKTYEIDLEKERIQRHETKNQLLTIKSKIYDKEKDSKVINYIDSILDEKIDISQEHYAKFQYLPANGLKALFYFKTNEAENKGIKVSINVSKRVENSLLYDLTTNEFKQLGRLIGIYLDNAIEASEISEDKVMGIEIYIISNNVEIIMSNSYVNDEKKISSNGRSTKGKNRGHGLLFANNILYGTNKYEANTTVTDKLYIQKLIIKKSIH